MPRIPVINPQSRVPTGSADFGNGGPANSVLGSISQGVGMLGRELDRRQAEAKAMRDRQAADEASIYATNAISRVRVKAQERMIQAQQSGDLSGLTDGLLKDLDTWAEAESVAAPEKAKPILAQQMAHIRGQLHEKAYGVEVAFREQKLVSDFQTGVDDDARLAFADPSQFTDLLARRLVVLDGMAIGADTKSKLAKQTRETLALQSASAMVERDPDAFLERVGVAGGKTGKDGKPLPSDPKEAAQRVQNDPVLSNLDPANLRQVVDRATMLKVQRDAAIAAERDRRERQAEAAAAKREREANQAYTILSDWAREGIVANPAAAKPLLDKIVGTPYQQAYMAHVAQVQSRASAAMLPVPTQRQRLQALYAERAKNGTSERLEREIQQSEQVLSASERDYKDDPLSGGVKRGLVSLTPVDVNAPPEQLAAQISQRLDAQQQMSTVIGRHAPPLTADEAVALRDQLNALPAKDRAARIASIAKAAGKSGSQGLASLMDSKDRALSLAFASAADTTTSGRFTSELILRGQEAKRDGTSTKGLKEPEVKASAWRATVSQELAGVYDDQRQYEQVRDAAEFIVHGIASEQGGSVSSDDIQRAVRLATGGTFIEHNGRKTPIPAGVDEDTFTKRVTSFKPADFARQAPDGHVYASGVKIPLDRFVQSLPAQPLMPVGRGRYAVLVSGRPATDAKGEPIVFEVR